MPEILCYMPTYSPFDEVDLSHPRPYRKLTQEEIAPRLAASSVGRRKPWVYMDAIDSILNIRPDIPLIVGDGKSTESIREHLVLHWNESSPKYILEFYTDRLSQWAIFNHIIEKYSTSATKYFVYSSSDVIWQMDWVAEAIKEFEKNPKLQILYPLVNNGDSNLPCQVSPGPIDMDPMMPPYQEAAKAAVLNAYVMIIRMDFLRAYGGYPTLFRNCYTESFLPYMCRAIGSEQRLLPRGWCFHWGTVDLWQENGSAYYYNEEIGLFQDTMNAVKMAEGMRMLTPEFLKKLLYKQAK